MIRTVPGHVPGRDSGPFSGRGRVGFHLTILLAWMVFEIARPSRPFGIPGIISLVSVGLWLSMSQDRHLGRQGRWWFVIMAGAGIMVPMAANGFSAYEGFKQLAILMLCICLPLQAVLRSVRDVRWWVYVLLASTFYVAVWASFHGGYGPAGAAGSQDENYVAALMCMTLPFAYFSILFEKRKVLKLMFAACIVAFVAAIAAADNASRGGFLALIAVALYCLWRSPRKGLGITVLALGAIALVAVAGPAFWAEISSSTEVESGTGDLRLKAWAAGFRMWVAHPIFGVGPGNFRWEIANFETAAQVRELGRSLGGSMVAHSMWVELLAELGLVGVISTVSIGLLTWKGLEEVQDVSGRFIARGDRRFEELRAYAYATQAGIIGVAVSGVFLSLLYYPQFWLLMVAGTALHFIFRSIMAQQGGVILKSRGRRPRRASRSASAGPVHPGGAR